MTERLRSHSTLLQYESAPVTSVKPPQLATTTIVSVCVAFGTMPFVALIVCTYVPVVPASAVPEIVRVVAL